MPKDASLKNKIHVGVGSVSDRVLVEPGAVCPMQAEGKFTVFLQGMYWAEAANSLSVVRPPLVLLMGSSWRSLVWVRPPWLCRDFQGDFSCWVCAESFTWPWSAGGCFVDELGCCGDCLVWIPEPVCYWCEICPDTICLWFSLHILRLSKAAPRSFGDNLPPFCLRAPPHLNVRRPSSFNLCVLAIYVSRDRH